MCKTLTAKELDRRRRAEAELRERREMRVLYERRLEEMDRKRRAAELAAAAAAEEAAARQEREQEEQRIESREPVYRYSL